MNETKLFNTAELTLHREQNKCKLTNETVIYMTIYCVVIALVFGGNVFILKTLVPLKKHSRYRNIDLFLVYLAIFDLLATLMIIIDVYENLTCFVRWPFGFFSCKLVYPCYHISLSMTVSILAIMSIDRCRSITMPMKEKFTHRSIHSTVLVSFILSVALQWYQFNFLEITPSGHCNANKQVLMFAVPRLLSIFLRDGIFLVTFTVTTVQIYRSMKNHEKKIRNFYSKSKRGSQSVISMLIVMEVAFLLLVMPYDVYDCAMYISRIVPGFQPIKITKTIRHVDKILSILQMSNSFANCFIYAKMHEKIHQRQRTLTGRGTKNLTVSMANSTVRSPQSKKSITSVRLTPSDKDIPNCRLNRTSSQV